MKPCIGLATGACLGALLSAALPAAVAMETGYFQPPNMDGFLKIDEYTTDGDKDGRAETRVRRYRNAHGDAVFSMSGQDGRVWAWSLDMRSKDDANILRHYVIRDSNCDGNFDERYQITEGFDIPKCVP